MRQQPTNCSYGLGAANSSRLFIRDASGNLRGRTRKRCDSQRPKSQENSFRFLWPSFRWHNYRLPAGGALPWMFAQENKTFQIAVRY